MKVNVVGTSCTWFKRKNTSYIIDDNILLDVPEGAYKDITNTIDIFGLKCVLISHIHTDHALDLHVIATRHMRENHGRKEPLRVYGPKGLFDTILTFNKLFNGGADECERENYEGFVEFIELENGMTFDEGEYTITAFKVEHGKPETYGFTFADKTGKVIGFSTDTTICENLHKIISSSDFAFVEVASIKPSKTHICLEEYLNLLKTYPNTKIYPVHTCDACQKYVEENNLNPLHDGQILEF